MKIHKDLDMEANNKDEPPSSARQVRVERIPSVAIWPRGCFRQHHQCRPEGFILSGAQSAAMQPMGLPKYKRIVGWAFVDSGKSYSCSQVLVCNLPVECI